VPDVSSPNRLRQDFGPAGSRARQHGWLALRAVLAVVLMVAFYALALGVAAGLLGLAYLDLTKTSSPAIRLVIFCVFGAGSIVWAIVPRRDRFEPPGPRLTKEEQPELFACIAQVARATEQAEPADVYLTNDVNAFVAQRGGLIGVGARRVMGLGLPLMQALSVDEFRAVLTHEFGHYHAGDVALGPWLYQTQRVIVRTIAQLANSLLRFIFLPFATLFFRTAHAVSRRQEFIADELAARLVGPGAMTSGLRKVNVAAVAYQAYWASEVAPVVSAGFRPPMAAGFSQYFASPAVAPFLRDVAAKGDAAARSGPYDTHPSLGERVAALSRQPAQPVRDSRPATTLLRDLDACEQRLLAGLRADFAALKPLAWTDVTGQVYEPIWRARVAAHGGLLAGYTLGSPPRTAIVLRDLGKSIAPTAPAPAHTQVAWQLLVAACAVALMREGWTAETEPGQEVVLRRGGDELRPYSEIEAVVAGQRAAADWEARCAALGVAALPLGAADGAAVAGA
jgi:Zn-dependent protease with chaperone function